MKCSNCNRRIGKTMEARFRHYAKYHPDRVAAAALAMVNRVIQTFPTLRAIGAGIGGRK